MKYFKILPAAAGVIALTATVAFARDLRDTEEGYASLRIKVTASNPAYDADSASLQQASSDGGAGHLYLVEVARENVKNVITIDAGTGKILDSRKIPV